MLMTVDDHNRPLYKAACAFERVMGSKCWSSLECYGEHRAGSRFLLQHAAGEPSAALYGAGKVLYISANELAEPGELADFVVQNDIREVDTNRRLCERLRQILGGEMESSYYMEYPGGPIEGDYSDVLPCRALEEVFTVLQQSHEYYRSHLRFDAWSEDIRMRLRFKVLELYQVNDGDEPIGTGCISSFDDECGVVSAVAVVPEHRGRGLGKHISSFLTNRILAHKKTPRLLSGYDEVAALYRGIGYRETGRWGELYL